MNFYLKKGNPSYSGDLCENVLCDNPDPKICYDFKLSDCLQTAIFYYCPQLCRYCSYSTTIITSLINDFTETTEAKFITTTRTDVKLRLESNKSSSCEILNCQNKGYFNKKICKCDCLPSWTGDCKFFILSI